MTRRITMSMSPEDLEMVAAAERQTYEGISEGLSFWVPASGVWDPYTQTFQFPSGLSEGSWELASGIVSVLQEKDALLGMAGKLQVGDTMASFYYPDVEAFYESTRIRRESTGQVYSIEARVRTGLGPPFVRLELGLKPKPNQ